MRDVVETRIAEVSSLAIFNWVGSTVRSGWSDLPSMVTVSSSSSTSSSVPDRYSVPVPWDWPARMLRGAVSVAR